MNFATTTAQQDLFSWVDSVDKSRSRADQIFAAFVKFHRTNPAIWSLFERFAFDLINRGHKFYSSDSICHRIRWHTDVETTGDNGESCKLNNNYTAYYARLFQAKHPDHAALFRNRKRISQDGPAQENDLKVFIGGSPEAEEDLIKQLANL